jgi:hypothetical protein
MPGSPSRDTNRNNLPQGSLELHVVPRFRSVCHSHIFRYPLPEVNHCGSVKNRCLRRKSRAERRAPSVYLDVEDASERTLDMVGSTEITIAECVWDITGF